MKSIPIIDFNGKAVEQQMYDAYTTCGVAVFTNVYDEWLSEFRDWRLLMEEFFRLPLDTKKQYAYSGVKDNLGYNWLEEERQRKYGEYIQKNSHKFQKYYLKELLLA